MFKSLKFQDFIKQSIFAYTIRSSIIFFITEDLKLQVGNAVQHSVLAKREKRL